MSLPLDPSIASMCTAADLLGEPTPQRFVDVRLAAASAAIFVALFALASHAYAAIPERASYVRHLAYSEGVVKPPKRATREQRVLDEATRWGLNRKAVGL